MFLVIDGSSLMCVAYYGNLPEEMKQAKTDEEKQWAMQYIEQNSKGVYVNGIKSFLNTLLNILEIQKPDHMAICFDKGRSTTFRREILESYKAQRPETPVPLQKQMQNIQTVLKSVRIPVLADEKFEADDFAGSICKQFESEDMPVRFMTKDRDYLQLISPYTKGWMMTHSEAAHTRLSEKYGYQDEFEVPFGCYEYDEATVLGECGVKPSQIADWKGISGDNSDNLPGIKGAADKSAIPLLAHYGSLESIVSAVDNMEKKGKLDMLKVFWKEGLDIARPPVAAFVEHKNEGLLCKELATIKTDLPIGELEDYELNINLSLLRDLAAKLELDDIVMRVDGMLRSEEQEMSR